MTDRKLALILAVWLIVLLMLPLAWASLRGFDDSMCRQFNGCPWRNA